MNKDRIVLVVLALAITLSMDANAEFFTDAEILKNCRSMSSFAEMAKKDRDHHANTYTVLPFYYERARKNLDSHGYAPILDKDDERTIRAAADFMFADKSRTTNDYIRACLLAQDDTSPGWYLRHIKKYGMPPAMKIIASSYK